MVEEPGDGGGEEPRMPPMIEDSGVGGGEDESLIEDAGVDGVWRVMQSQVASVLE